MPAMSDQSRLTWALVLSVLLHGFLLSVLPFIRRAHIEIPTPPLLDVDVVSLPKQPAPAAVPAPAVAAPAPPAPAPPAIPVPDRQIVSPPDAGEEKEPPNARLLSDRNNTVKEETIHRGEPAKGDPDAEPQAPPPAKAKAERPPPPKAPPVERPRPNTQLAALPKLDQLLPPAGDLIREGIVKPQEPAAAAPAPAQQASNQRNDLLRGDPWKSGGLRGGSLDFLPAVREGDITLLNTKAEQFAPFVRRVAMRVFENFWIALRHNVSSLSGGSAQEYAIIEAVMDKRGRVVAINIKDRSTSITLATDRLLQSACQQGFFDRNPPPGAESNDGNIHFVFQAQVSVALAPRGGAAGGAHMSAGLL
jgi:hypothetical protein